MSMGIAQRTYVIVTILLTFCTVAASALFIVEKRDLMLENRKLQLYRLASALERSIDTDDFYSRINAVHALPIPQEEKVARINQWLQPILMALCEENPGYGFGIYAKQMESIVAIGPHFEKSFLRPVRRPEVVRVYQTGSPEFSQFSSSTGWAGGAAVYNLAYPITYAGEIIGHTWASARTQDVGSEIQLTIIQTITFVILFWLGMMLILHRVFRKWQLGIDAIKAYVKDDKNTEKLLALPEIDPLVNEIDTLRETLMREAEDRAHMQEELARLDRLNLIGEMAAGIAHEVRNPMTTVRGYLQVLSHKKDFSSYQEQFGTMIEEIDRANSIITEFLSLAKDKAVHMKTGNLRSLLASLLPLLQADAFQCGAQIKADIHPVPDSAFDPNEIRQLVLNLVRNSFEALNNSGTVCIRLYPVNDSIVLEVEDTGHGIPDDVLKKLGTPFVTTKASGTGLGLPICYRIAERHDARIEVNTSSEGTRFTITFTPSLALC